MSSNHSSIRVRGQRTIPLTFIHRISTDDDQEKMEDGRPGKKRPKISLSDFLDRKLQKTSGPSKLVQGKERPFLTPGTSVGANQSFHRPNVDQKTEKTELNGILDVALEQFKPIKENGDSVCLNPEESQIPDLTKSRNAFGGLHGKPPAPKGLVVLGDDPKPKQTRYHKSSIRNKKPLPLYNHCKYPIFFAKICILKTCMQQCRAGQMRGIARYHHLFSMKKPKLFWVSTGAPLLSVILSTLLVFAFKAQHHGISVIGELEQGLNHPSWNMLHFHGSHMGLVLKTGFVTGIISLTEGIAVGRTFAALKNYEVGGNKEMLAIGVMNVVGSTTSSYITTGSFSRSAVNHNAGAKTAASNIVMAVTVMVTLLLMSLFHYTPNLVLGAIIVTAVIGLIDIPTAYQIWKVDRFDFVVLLCAFFGVIFILVLLSAIKIYNLKL